MSFFDSQEEQALRDVEEGVCSDVDLDIEEVALKYGAIATGSQPLLFLGSAFLDATDKEASEPAWAKTGCPLYSPQPQRSWGAHPIPSPDPSECVEPSPTECTSHNTGPAPSLFIANFDDLDPREPRTPSPAMVSPVDIPGSSAVALNNAVGYLASDLCDVLMLEIFRQFYVAFTVICSWFVPAVAFAVGRMGRVMARKNAKKLTKIE